MPYEHRVTHRSPQDRASKQVMNHCQRKDIGGNAVPTQATVCYFHHPTSNGTSCDHGCFPSLRATLKGFCTHKRKTLLCTGALFSMCSKYLHFWLHLLEKPQLNQKFCIKLTKMSFLRFLEPVVFGKNVSKKIDFFLKTKVFKS